MASERQLTVDAAIAAIADLHIDRQITEIIIHHTWKPRAGDYRGIETVRGVRQYHKDTKGWADNGYQVMIGPPGAVFFCRPFSQAGAHCVGHNAHSFGLSYIADFDAQDPATYAGLEAGQRIVAALCKRFNLNTGHIYFHRDFANKSCPGNKMNRAEYRKAVKRFMDNPTADKPDVSPWAEEGVEWAIAEQIMTRFADGTFRGQEPMTREMAAVMAKRQHDAFYR